VIQDIAIAAILAGIGIWATRRWQRHIDARAADDVQQLYDRKKAERKKAEQLVSMRDA
jgi:hypothetical protein